METFHSVVFFHEVTVTNDVKMTNSLFTGVKKKMVTRHTDREKRFVRVTEIRLMC